MHYNAPGAGIRGDIKRYVYRATERRKKEEEEEAEEEAAAEEGRGVERRGRL